MNDLVCATTRERLQMMVIGGIDREGNYVQGVYGKNGVVTFPVSVDVIFVGFDPAVDDDTDQQQKPSVVPENQSATVNDK